MPKPPILYLDQCHLSNLALNPTGAGDKAIRGLLLSRRIRLAVSGLNIAETGRPFRSCDDLIDFVDACDRVLAVTNGAVFRQEAAATFARALGVVPDPVRWFVETAGEWFHSRLPAYHIGNYATFRKMVAFLRERPSLQKEMSTVDEAILSLANSRGLQAACVRDESIPIVRHLHHLLPIMTTPSGLAIPRILTARQVFDRGAKSIEDLPAHATLIRLVKERITQPGAKFTSNDVIDFNHASYSAYANISILEPKHANTLRRLRLPWSFRVFASPNEAISAVKSVVDTSSDAAA